MLIVIRRVVIALVGLAPLLSTGQAQAAGSGLTRVGTLQASTRPAGVPLDYIVTPNGYFHASCVVELGDDDKVQGDGSVVHADGSVQAMAACAYPSFGTHGQRVAGARQPPDGSYDGWLAYSDTDPSVSPAASALDANWVVPAAPTNAAGQTLYFFPGLESVPNTFTILQPVLAWRGYTNSAWTMANWNCCINGTIYTGKPIVVRAGDHIRGQMTGTGCATDQPCSAWQIVSTDTTTRRSTTMNTRAYGQIFNWYFGGVMEVYGVSTCDQFPASGSIDFKSVKVLDVNAQPITPSWLTGFNASAPDCSYVVTANPKETLISFNPAP